MMKKYIVTAVIIGLSQVAFSQSSVDGSKDQYNVSTKIYSKAVIRETSSSVSDHNVEVIPSKNDKIAVKEESSSVNETPVVIQKKEVVLPTTNKHQETGSKK